MIEFLENLYRPELMIKIAPALFFAIVFLQSAIDKLVDWNGNLGWLKGHFAESPLGSMVPFLLGLLTIAELKAGILCLLGVILLILGKGDTVAYWGILASAFTCIMLIFGQRIAKDYDGAKTITIYFGVALLSMSFFL